LISCYSAEVSGSYSVVGALDNAYGGKIKTLRGAQGCPALAKAKGGTEAKKIGDAAYYQGLSSKSGSGGTLVGTLTTGWQKDDFGSSKLTFQKYCENVALKDVSKFPAFFKEVEVKFGVDYLKLINDNDNGSDLDACGTAIGTPCK
jgi:hypothetical protein